jgi:hypothetical protein
MVITLGPAARSAIQASKDCLLLGIILVGGSVRLTVADAATPGHADWMRRDGIVNAYRGFSVFVRDGQVAAMMRTSTLNSPANAYLLEADFLQQLESMLPLAPNYVCYDH